MSTSRIIFGALLGGLLLGCDLAAMWHLEFSFGIVLGASSVTAVVVNFVFEDARRRKALRLYFEQEGLGMRWRSRFPHASSTSIHEFLGIFVDSFGFKPAHAGSFSPDDRVLDVYRAINPPGNWIDCMEMEELARQLHHRYRLDLHSIWRNDLNLGDIYAHLSPR